MSHHFRAVVLDFDGTLTEGGRPAPDVLAAISEAREDGRKVVLASGRILSELRSVFPDVDAHFDGLVAENGGVLSIEASDRVLAPPVPFELDEALVERGIAFRRGQVLLACHGSAETEVFGEIRRLGLEVQIVRNRAELMVLPPGVSKGQGVFEILGDLGYSHHNAIGVGDAENDHSLLGICELGVAVANAVPSLQAHADVVLAQSDGKAVADLLRGPLLSGELRIEPKRWQVDLGRFDDGAPARIPGSQVNLLIAGRSRSGKSFLAGLLAERLIVLGYSLCIVDPEGDYAPLARLRGVLRVGGDKPLPPPGRVSRLLEHRFGSLVVDLSLLPPQERGRYVATLLPALERERNTTGLPHWILIDEAHDSTVLDALDVDVVRGSKDGYCLVTYRPELVCERAADAIDVALLLPSGAPAEPPLRDPIDSLEKIYGGGLAREVAAARFGQAVLMRPDAREPARRFTIGERRSPHVRHWHKYAYAQLPSQLRFVFRDGVGRSAHEAGNLEEFHRALVLSDAGVIRHHLSHRDFSHWVHDAIQDSELARRIRSLEVQLEADGSERKVDALRMAILKEIEARYLG